MTLKEAIKYSNLNKELNSLWDMKKEKSKEEFENFLYELEEKKATYRNEFILNGKHMTETYKLFNKLAYKDYNKLDKLLSYHLNSTKDDIFLENSYYYINETEDYIYITICSKFKNYPKLFEQYKSIRKTCA